MRPLEDSRTLPWSAVLCTVLMGLAAHSPASAFTFTRIGDGSGQYMAWLWEFNPPVTSCLNSFPPSPCGNAFAVDGNIAMNFHSNTRTVAGGSLTWSLPPGSLKVVALTRVGANSTSTAGSYAGAWASIDARPARLDFVMQSEPGDPPFIDLAISPLLVGTVTQTGSQPGSEADVQYEMMMSVIVDGVVVTHDSLYATYPLSGVNTMSYRPLLPRGTSNSLLLPSVPPGTEISIGLWAYMRAITNGLASVTASSVYGDGPAIEVIVQAANVVGVGEEIETGLRLRARPNPTVGSSTVLYTLPRAAGVRLSIYDVAGHRVTTLADRAESAGSHELAWNGRDERGGRVAAGVYVLELVAGPERTVAKLVVLGR